MPFLYFYYFMALVLISPSRGLATSWEMVDHTYRSIQSQAKGKKTGIVEFLQKNQNFRYSLYDALSEYWSELEAVSIVDFEKFSARISGLAESGSRTGSSWVKPKLVRGGLPKVPQWTSGGDPPRVGVRRLPPFFALAIKEINPKLYLKRFVPDFLAIEGRSHKPLAAIFAMSHLPTKGSPEIGEMRFLPLFSKPQQNSEQWLEYLKRLRTRLRPRAARLILYDSNRLVNPNRKAGHAFVEDVIRNFSVKLPQSARARSIDFTADVDPKGFENIINHDPKFRERAFESIKKAPLKNLLKWLPAFQSLDFKRLEVGPRRIILRRVSTLFASSEVPTRNLQQASELLGILEFEMWNTDLMQAMKRLIDPIISFETKIVEMTGNLLPASGSSLAQTSGSSSYVPEEFSSRFENRELQAQGQVLDHDAKRPPSDVFQRQKIRLGALKDFARQYPAKTFEYLVETPRRNPIRQLAQINVIGEADLRFAPFIDYLKQTVEDPNWSNEKIDEKNDSKKRKRLQKTLEVIRARAKRVLEHLVRNDPRSCLLEDLD